MIRIAASASFILLVGCSSSQASGLTDASADGDASGDDAACGAPRFTVYPTAGCNGVAPVCADPTDTACINIVCGCDDRIHVYDCAGARAPFSSVEGRGEEGDPCGDAGVDGGDAGKDASDVGPCGAGKHEAFTEPGCSATPTCLPDGPEDACSSPFCGCDGITFWGSCGYATKPFASSGSCPDEGG